MTDSTPISRDELVRDLSTANPLPKSKIRQMIDAYVAQEVAKATEKRALVATANKIYLDEVIQENTEMRDAIRTLMSYGREESA